ncbi:hypothetical protein COCCADRAFT_88067 [Bipolaris zeicola 26-R-13]|uniref:Methyltransferase domain-containing protein n=1 Tax=Cochliobolus carbonum (strain 26-R-13) TaxID=930089 RepID=W6YFI6_COCC2|nr:uncharacterized protein COCCADRAFT_88067 [Bipolaris zeicola 26-R-13]EUC36450.1 hypothetical protein COCCADRAFT_88067 [Bipolaris zeicola 26-R-13]
MALENFNPDTFLDEWSEEKYSPLHTEKSLARCMGEAFDIPPTDSYVYRAHAQTTLHATQRAIDAKREHGLHGWYQDEEGQPTYPTPDEITTYTSLFSPSTSLPKSLNSLLKSSKANSLRQKIATHLTSRYLNTTPPNSSLLPSKKDREHKNPYLDLWNYSCSELEWAGPVPETAGTKISHHILPLFYHHFGCVVPSYAALHVLAKLAQPARPSKEDVRPILDIGSGNGYWTYMLRHFPVAHIGATKELDVRAVDSQVSEYRVMWIKDTIKMDGRQYLMRNGGGKGCVLLLVYPQATGDFTGPMMKAFEGDTIVVAGTQNGNGFTGFRDVVVDEWVEKNLNQFELVLRMPLPSFAGKDEALFVFQRKKSG